MLAKHQSPRHWRHEVRPASYIDFERPDVFASLFFALGAFDLIVSLKNHTRLMMLGDKNRLGIIENACRHLK